MLNRTRMQTVVVLALLVLGSLPTFARQDQQSQGGGQNRQGQQSKKPPLSPPKQAKVTLDGKDVTIDYSAPSKRNRQIMGGLVPYGKVWRTGANAATTLITATDLTIGGTPVPAGKYTLYTVPEQDKWTLIVNKQTGQWGTQYDEKQDLARIPMKVTQTSQPVEQFEIRFDKTSNDAATLVMDWENTQASVDVKAGR